MGGCAASSHKLSSPLKISPEFEPIKRYIRSYDESILFAEINSVVQLLATASEEKFKKHIETLNSFYLNAETDSRQHFNIILLIYKILQARPQASKYLFEQKISTLLVTIKDVNLSDPCVSSYSSDEEYNYWQRATNINLEFIQYMSDNLSNKRGDNYFKEFKLKNSHLFPRKSQYLSLGFEIKEKIEKEGKSVLAEIKTLRLTAIDETVQQIINGGKFLPLGPITEKYLSTTERHTGDEILKMQRDIIKIMQVDHLRTLLINELEGAALLNTAYKNSQKNKTSCEEFISIYKQIIACRYPEVLKSFDIIMPVETHHLKQTAGFPPEGHCIPEPTVRGALKSSLSGIPSMDPKEFFSHEHIRSILENENAKSEKEKSFNDTNSLNERSQNSFSGKIRRKGSYKVINFTPPKKETKGDVKRNELNTLPLSPLLKSKPSREENQKYMIALSRENSREKKLQGEYSHLVSENEELELLIATLEEEKRICQKKLLNTSSQKGGDSYISARSFRSNRTAMNLANSNTIELQRILRDKESMLLALEHKYEMLLAEDSPYLELKELEKAGWKLESQRYTNEAFKRVIGEPQNIASSELSYSRRNDRIKNLEKEKFLHDLYVDIDKTLHNR